MYAIEINNLEFGYGDSLILKGIDFNVLEGEFLSIIGPNGSGKSTLLKTLNRIYGISNGSITILGKDIADYNSRQMARQVALVPQETHLDYEFRVEDVVMMGRHPYKGRFEKEDEEDYNIVYESMKLTNTLYLKDRLITEISGGERQRVFIAKALAQKPSIMLLDEPTSHLDINHQMDVLNLLKELNENKGMTIVLVIHDINLAARYSDEIVLLNSGIIQGKGSPDQVITTENMERAYNLNVAIEKNKYTNTTYLTPIEIRRRPDETMKKVHVICGGGSGQDAINKLFCNGYKLSLGVLNVGDTDYSLGRSLGIPVVEEIPFGAISDKAYKKNTEMVKKVDVIIITEVAIGQGNLKNYQVAYEALKEGKKVYFIGNDDFKCLDYTNGKGYKLIEDMIDLGLIIVEDADKFMKMEG